MIVQRDPIEDKKIGINVLTGILFVVMITVTVLSCVAIRNHYDEKFINEKSDIREKYPTNSDELKRRYAEEFPQPVKSYEAF